MKKEKPTVYAVSNAHLDTAWLWTYEQSAGEFVPDTAEKNLALLKKFPDYKFNFEGSLRYELLKEYRPDLYSEVKQKIREGRWNPCGACYENGDVNIPSPEALIRNIVYGNGYFEDEFGVKSNDIFLPDCFGFGLALPTVAAHCGVQGFSTGKLVWGSSADVPFHIGKWNGIDGNGVTLVTNTGSYTTILKKIRQNKRILEKLNKNIADYNMPVAFCYHGNGDRGGAPSVSSVRAACDAQKENAKSDIRVLSATTKEFFADMQTLFADQNVKVPEWNEELLMTEHGAGSYTSRTVTKRWNRRSELLADAAERFCVAAMVNGLSDYPQYGLDAAWKKVIAHHFHDDITGTSFEECYKRSYNDYVQAMHTFSEEFTAACKALACKADTSFAKGIPVVVANPVQGAESRREAVCVALDCADSIRVFDKDGREVPSQKQNDQIVFIADVPSCGFAVYDVRESDTACTQDTGLTVCETALENKYIRVQLNADGDISSVFDKRLSRELLKNPVRAEILSDVHSFRWPAWEIKYDDIISKPYLYPTAPVVRVKENGPARVSLEIVRKAGKSTFTQVISLDAESGFVSVYNETDWREEASLLKMRFDLAAENENADYDIGIGFTQRGINTKRKYEVPAQKWAGIRDGKDDFGVAVFSDSRCGWDHPAKETLRLTCMHTPMASYRHECSQHLLDMGLNRYCFAIGAYTGTTEKITASADAFCQPMHTFVTDAHEGSLPAAYSFASLSTDAVRILALKKAQKSNAVILRVAECTGKAQAQVTARFANAVRSAYEVTGDEVQISEYPVADGKLNFKMPAFGVRSFALEFAEAQANKNKQQPVSLACNACGITDNQSRAESTLAGKVSLPAELMPENLRFAGVDYAFAKGERNCLVCKGQTVQLPDGFGKVHLLLTSLDGDREVQFAVGSKKVSVRVPACNEPLGMWDLMSSKLTGFVKEQPQALSLSHTHSENKDLVGKQFYLFHAELVLDEASAVTLPEDEKTVIFAMTAEQEAAVFAKGDAHFDRLEKRPFDYSFSKDAVKHATENRFERLLDKFIDRTRCVHITADGMYNKNSVADMYFGVHFVLDGLMDKKRRNSILNKRK